MVALAIVALALLAGTQATSALALGAERETDIVLAHVCAENELVRVRLAQQMPSIGDSQVLCEQAGRRYQVRVHTTPTPNPQFRRVDAQVLTDSLQPVLRLSTIVGRY